MFSEGRGTSCGAGKENYHTQGIVDVEAYYVNRPMKEKQVHSRSTKTGIIDFLQVMTF